MDLREYKFCDFDIIRSWLQSHNHVEINRDTLPENGLIAFTKERDIAVGFLRLCEGDLSIIESFVTNPTAGFKEKKEAIDLLVMKLTKLSGKLGRKKIIGLSRTSSILNRAKKLGFIEIPEVVFVKKLDQSECCEVRV